jgi:hypothetical protein
MRAVLSWICVALLFGVLIARSMGRSSALKFFAGYFLELSLSVDNLFAFMAIVDFFQIKGRDEGADGRKLGHCARLQCGSISPNSC